MMRPLRVICLNAHCFPRSLVQPRKYCCIVFEILRIGWNTFGSSVAFVRCNWRTECSRLETDLAPYPNKSSQVQFIYKADDYSWDWKRSRNLSWSYQSLATQLVLTHMTFDMIAGTGLRHLVTFKLFGASVITTLLMPLSTTIKLFEALHTLWQTRCKVNNATHECYHKRFNTKSQISW